MAMCEFESKQEYVAALTARGLKCEPMLVAEEEPWCDYACGETGRYYGIGTNIPNDGDDGCEVGPPDYYAVLFEMPSEFETYMEADTFWEPRGCPTGEYVPDAEDEENLREEQADKLARRNVRSTVKLYPLTQAELHMAEENGGVTEHVPWHEITCTSVWVEAGVPRALYEFWYMGEEGQLEWAKFWLTVRDGKLYGEW